MDWFRADSLGLQQHAELIMRERQAARLLAEQLRLEQSLLPPGDTELLMPLISSVEALFRYFSSMADQVENMSTEVVLLSLEIHELLERLVYRER